jgi:hypothetical protein
MYGGTGWHLDVFGADAVLVDEDRRDADEVPEKVVNGPAEDGVGRGGQQR